MRRRMSDKRPDAVTGARHDAPDMARQAQALCWCWLSGRPTSRPSGPPHPKSHLIALGPPARRRDSKAPRGQP